MIGGLAVAGAGLAVGLYWFEPWQLWVEDTVNEAVPSASAAPKSDSPATPPAEPRMVAQGTLISHEHATTGTVKLLRLADGSHTLRLENLDTSNGPDLRVWLTDAPVIQGRDGWHVFDDGKHVSLGELKGNKGDQNYPVPADVNLADYTSLSIWCDRFNVSFGAAALNRT
ncbi:DM13 domain-containing protein [Streptomyces sp. NPDC051211]|uniref:DM13 domain-containing protein n=1 Tax=Streptomyces sp. NPDC051211 TaxID=3154643 RepID=UPI00344E5BF3